MTNSKEKPKKKLTTKSKKQNKIKHHILQVTMLSLVIFSIIFFGYQIINLAINPTDSFLIEQGKISQEESVVGYVIRDEKVIQMPEDGKKVVQIKNEGEKVQVGEEVFRYEAQNEEKLYSKIKELNDQIQTAMEGQEKLPSSDIKALENQIEIKIKGAQSRNNLQDIKEYKTDIDSYITKKAKISGELSPSGSYINNLISQRTNIENELKNNSKYEKAQMSGIVSYRVDGLEETLSPSNLESLTVEQLKGLNLATGQIVTTSEQKAKIINNFECYIAVTSKTEEAKKAEIGDKVTIRLSASQEIPAKVQCKKENNGTVLLIVKITQGVEYLTCYRKISLDLIWWEQEGLRIPNTSIIYENGLSYVIRTKLRSSKQNTC